jgi:hypothetical protein
MQRNLWHSQASRYKYIYVCSNIPQFLSYCGQIFLFKYFRLKILANEHA